MSPKRTLPSFIFFLLVLLWAGFIFSKSMEDGAASYETSSRFIRLIDSSLLDDPETALLAQAYFRKSAHFFEFFLLGTFFFFMFSGTRKPGIPAFFFSVLAAFLDEGLQVFSDRGNSLRDVILDSCGAAAAIMLLIFIFHLRRNRKKRTSSGKQP